MSWVWSWSQIDIGRGWNVIAVPLHFSIYVQISIFAPKMDHHGCGDGDDGSGVQICKS